MPRRADQGDNPAAHHLARFGGELRVDRTHHVRVIPRHAGAWKNFTPCSFYCVTEIALHLHDQGFWVIIEVTLDDFTEEFKEPDEVGRRLCVHVRLQHRT